MFNYVIITPAHNEEMYITKTIESVIAQTAKPAKWVIVDDGSTDRTAAIVSEYLPDHPFMLLLRLPARAGRSFGNKVAAFKAGFDLLAGMGWSFVGNLDADVSFASDYYEKILAEFQRAPMLGIAGGIVYTKVGRTFRTDDTNLDNVGGCIQLFRKECFDQIGGYMPLQEGGIDAAAEIMARMKGWTVRKFPENRIWEHRRTGSAGSGVLAAMYKLGVRFHSLGYGTSFFIVRSVYRARYQPILLGSLICLLGFTWAKLRRYPLRLPPEVVSYLRSEQTKKLRARLFGRVLGTGQSR